MMMLDDQVVFVREAGFPRRWRAVGRIGRSDMAIVTQEHARNGQGKSVFRYRAALLPDRQIGLFTTLRGAKRAITEALDA